MVKWRGKPRANPNAPSAKACSSNHWGADKTNGSWGISIPPDEHPADNTKSMPPVASTSSETI